MTAIMGIMYNLLSILMLFGLFLILRFYKFKVSLTTLTIDVTFADDNLLEGGLSSQLERVYKKCSKGDMFLAACIYHMLMLFNQ